MLSPIAIKAHALTADPHPVWLPNCSIINDFESTIDIKGYREGASVEDVSYSDIEEIKDLTPIPRYSANNFYDYYEVNRGGKTIAYIGVTSDTSGCEKRVKDKVKTHNYLSSGDILQSDSSTNWNPRLAAYICTTDKNTAVTVHGDSDGFDFWVSPKKTCLNSGVAL